MCSMLIPVNTFLYHKLKHLYLYWHLLYLLKWIHVILQVAGFHWPLFSFQSINSRLLIIVHDWIETMHICYIVSITTAPRIILNLQKYKFVNIYRLVTHGVNAWKFGPKRRRKLLQKHFLNTDVIIKKGLQHDFCALKCRDDYRLESVEDKIATNLFWPPCTE